MKGRTQPITRLKMKCLVSCLSLLKAFIKNKNEHKFWKRTLLQIQSWNFLVKKTEMSHLNFFTLLLFKELDVSIRTICPKSTQIPEMPPLNPLCIFQWKTKLWLRRPAQVQLGGSSWWGCSEFLPQAWQQKVPHKCSLTPVKQAAKINVSVSVDLSLHITSLSKANL